MSERVLTPPTPPHPPTPHPTHPYPAQFGILLADGRNGPFRFEVQYVRALAEFNPTDYTSAAEQMMREQRALAEPTRQLGDGASEDGGVRLRPDSSWLRTPPPQARGGMSRVTRVDDSDGPLPSQGLAGGDDGGASPQGGGEGDEGQGESLRDRLRRLREAAKLK